MSHSPGMRNLPRASMTRASAGGGAERDGATDTIRLPRTTTVWSGSGLESAPSMTFTWVNASAGCSATELERATQATRERAATASSAWIGARGVITMQRYTFHAPLPEAFQ